VYVKPARAGQTHWTTTQEKLTTPVSVLVALFLLGLAVPRASLPDEPQWLQTGMVVPCDFDSSLVMAYVSLYPFDLPTGETLYFVTDWHPHVLSMTTRFLAEEEPVMYLGPDSLALAHHFILGVEETVEQWLDLCTGSGIQAILAVKRQLCLHAVGVDVNPRALRLAAFNARLNQVEDDQITFLQKDLLQDDPVPGNYQVITANPPFLPVPPQIPVHRHGWFSSGGPSGAAVVQAILQQAQNGLLEPGGKLAMVSEFFAKDGVYPPTGFGRALLFTNASPLSVTEYARRRADSATEYRIWRDHLADYDHMSPGLLYLHNTPQPSWNHVAVPASSHGSLWTPGNVDAIQFTRECSQEYLGWFQS
jgi:methylase of polypeptide subunit release factors